MLGVAISIDEMTMGFQGRHKDKKRITYKAEGDGFQCDALCQEGYTYQFYMWNDPSPEKYRRYSPLHARVMALYDTLVKEYHSCAFDNLYKSAMFCKELYGHPKYPLIHGVARKGGRGIPSCVQQEEVTLKEALRKVRGTVKAAKLEGDKDSPFLIVSSVYDTKSVHYLSMVSETVKWVLKERDVYNVDTGAKEVMKFLCLIQID